jgi:hypothetical protein
LGSLYPALVCSIVSVLLGLQNGVWVSIKAKFSLNLGIGPSL